jgi:hypothetical protein
MKKIREEDNTKAEEHAKRLLEETLADGGEIFMVCKSGHEIGNLIMGDSDILAKVIAFLTTKDPEIKDLMLRIFRFTMEKIVKENYGPDAIQKLMVFLEKEFPLPNEPFMRKTGEA